MGPEVKITSYNNVSPLFKGNIFSIIGKLNFNLFLLSYFTRSVKFIFNFRIYFIIMSKFVNFIKYNRRNKLKSIL